LLVECKGLIWITGVGTSASVGNRFAHILTCCGARSIFLSPSDGLHGHSGVIEPADILIGLSRGGESDDVIRMVEIANQREATTIAFVHNTASELARICQHTLPIQSKQEYELESLLATTSTVAFSAMCDALSAIVCRVKGFHRDQFGKIHPHGAVGKDIIGA
jgi:arabinose-5-phosphate isomerase